MSEAEWTATYRLQLNRAFPLQRAAEVLPYLASLGVSHVYLSPCLQATPGSEHGYDVVDPTRISDDLGGEEAWKAFQKAARAHGLGVLLDIVPNHMSTAVSNRWWNDVLQHGPYSTFARYFDLSPCADGEPWRIRLCSLGQPYGEALAGGELRVDLAGEEPLVTYHNHVWPLNPLTWSLLVPEKLERKAPRNVLPTAWREELDPGDEARRRYREAVGESRRWWAGLRSDSATHEALGAAVDELTQTPDRLHRVLEQQYYRPCWWRLEGEAVNYRRFFNIGSLVGVRMEDPDVFTATHARIMQMVEAGEVDGLRVDHPDGLRDPAGYLAQLRGCFPQGRIYVEKILDADETLPESWPVDGTVGYDFMSKANRLWMAGESTDRLTAIYADFTGHTVNFPALVREKKLSIIEAIFVADRDRLVEQAIALARRHWRTQDISREQLRHALVVLTAILPIYRTYLPGGDDSGRTTDLKVLDAALAQAASFARGIDAAVFAFLRDLLADARPEAATADFIARWQQLTPAVMAKGSEDTTFYLFDRLVSGNEVGAQPSYVGISTEQFHAYCHRLHEHWPRNLLATSTHDNKRSEDVRIRISLLTEITDRWSEAVQAWSRVNQPAWQGRSPDRHAEYLLYQTLVGAWPIDVDRARNYMLKACREAKVHTSWHEPNPEYESAITGFVTQVFESREFMESMNAFVAPLLHAGRVHSLAQTLIKLTAPGVPDFYQGTELWDLSLVDPDNRRPVDFACRRELVARSAGANPAEVLADWDSGWPKVWLIARVLAFRREHPEWFGAAAAYEPLAARGPRLAHVLGFRRGADLIVLVPRFMLTLDGDWGDTSIVLPDGTWANLFADGSFSGDMRVGDLFAGFPVALLWRRAESSNHGDSNS